jgi:hypothetical protein
MASIAERFHIVLSPDERRAWNAGASKLGLPTAEYVRRAVASFESGLTTGELEQLSDLATEVEQSASRMRTMINDTLTSIDKPVDEANMQARAAALIAQDPVLLDPRLLDFGQGFGTAQAA